MKRFYHLVTLIIIVTMSNRCLAQSSFWFSNFTPALDAPVYDATGNRLFGDTYVAQLYGGTDPSALVSARLYDFWDRVAPPAPFLKIGQGQAGYFDAAGLVIPTDFCGAAAWLQVRAWDTRLGNSYEEVVASGLGGYGESDMIRLVGGNPCENPTTPAQLVGLESFSLRAVVPEPSAALLLLLGLPVLMWRHYRAKRLLHTSSNLPSAATVNKNVSNSVVNE